MSVATGLGVLHELLEDEVDDVVGPKGKRSPEREPGPLTAPARCRLRPMRISLIATR